MLRNRPSILLSVLVLFIVLTAPISSAADDQISDACPLAGVELIEGLPRLEAETRIAAALGRRLEYSAFANNLRGGVVGYQAGACVLEVAYLPGAPAPRLATSDGKSMHLPPRDESVVTVRLIRLPKGQ